MNAYLSILALFIAIFLPGTTALAHTTHSDNFSHFHGFAFVNLTSFIGLILMCAISAAALVHFNINKKRV